MNSHHASLIPAEGIEDSISPKTRFGNTMGSMVSSGSASLKGKLLSLEEHVRAITDEMNFHKKEVTVLRSEKDTLQEVLTMKINDVRKSLTSEISRVEEEMKRHFTHQKSENNRLQNQINLLKGEKTTLQAHIMKLQSRISELENQIGNEDS